jgi:hypothetical protein
LHKKPYGCGASVASAAGPFLKTQAFHSVKKRGKFTERYDTYVYHNGIHNPPPKKNAFALPNNQIALNWEGFCGKLSREYYLGY